MTHPINRRAATLATLPLLLAGLVAWPAGATVPTDQPAPDARALAQADPSVAPSPATPAASPVVPVASPVASAVPDPSAPMVSVTLDRTDAADGDTVRATVSVTNPGPDPLTLRCARPVDVWADISDVVEGPRQDWATTDPWRRGMRKALLGDPLTGTGPLAVTMEPADRPRCTTTTRELAAGETFTADYTWDVGYADGTALFGPAGDPALVRARVVPLRTKAQTDAGEDAVAPVAAEAPVHVASVRSRRAMSPSRAIEALFSDPEAAAWLDLEHASTWRRADLRLRGGRWLVDVRRVATGCCRESLSAAMDGLSGEMRSLDAPLLAWEAAKTQTRIFENLELRLELQRRRFPDGRATRIRMTVTNLSQDGPVWYWSHDNSCTLQPGIWIGAGPEQVGVRWPGVLGQFKRRALRGDLIISRAGAPAEHQCRVPEPLKLRKKGGSVTTESFYRPGIVPTGQRTLAAIGRIDLVGPSSDTVRPWRVYASPEVSARFRTGKGSTQIDSPGMLIDAALSQKAFAKRIKATPRFRWKTAGVTGQTVWLELKDGTRIVALPQVEG